MPRIRMAEDTTGRYRQTALSDTLRSDHPESIRPFVLMLGAHFVWKPSGALQETVRTGQPSFERVYGAPFFEYLAGHPDDAAVFNAAMSSSPGYLAAIVGESSMWAEAMAYFSLESSLPILVCVASFTICPA